MIVKPQDFKGTALVPNAMDEDIPLSGFVGTSEELNLFIQDYEPEALILVLGFDLYSEFIENIDETTGEPKTDAEQKWKDLFEGRDRYRGIKRMLVNYIFFKFYENDNSGHFSGVGTVKENAKGAVSYDPKEKAVKAWRKFIKEAVGDGYFSGNIIIKSNAIGVIYGGGNNQFQSVQQFISENNDDYPNATFVPIKNMNYYGI